MTVSIDVGKLSEPLSKLIEATRAAIGTVYEPTHIRRIAKARADALIISDEGLSELGRRAANRVASQELRRQEVIDRVVEKAMAELPDRVSASPVDPGWVTRFFADCQDVSDEGLQAIWAKILAAEVADPGACSRQTLSILKELSPDDAAMFSRMARYAIRTPNDAFLPSTWPHENYPWRFSFDDLMHAEALGLLHVNERITVSAFHGDLIQVGGCEFYAIVGRGTESGVKAIPFTRAGRELARLCPVENNAEYVLYALDRFRYAHVTAVSAWPRGSRIDTNAVFF
jgi:hypothetical protein